MIPAFDAERRAHRLGLAVAGARRDTKTGAEFLHCYVRRRTLVRQEVDLAKGIKNPAGPTLRLPRQHRARPFAAQRRRSAPRQLRIALVEVPAAERVR